jgi:hypothetical protein
LALDLALAGEADNALAALAIEERRFPGFLTLRIKGVVFRICGRALESATVLAEERSVSALSPIISMERLVSARMAGDEKESAAAMVALKMMAGRADSWHGLIFGREEQAEAIEKTFTFAADALKGSGKALLYERRSPITWWHAVK